MLPVIHREMTVLLVMQWFWTGIVSVYGGLCHHSLFTGLVVLKHGNKF